MGQQHHETAEHASPTGFFMDDVSIFLCKSCVEFDVRRSTDLVEPKGSSCAQLRDVSSGHLPSSCHGHFSPNDVIRAWTTSPPSADFTFSCGRKKMPPIELDLFFSLQFVA
jgi:hypothetical protein